MLDIPKIIKSSIAACPIRQLAGLRNLMTTTFDIYSVKVSNRLQSAFASHS